MRATLFSFRVLLATFTAIVGYEAVKAGCTDPVVTRQHLSQLESLRPYIAPEKTYHQPRCVDWMHHVFVVGHTCTMDQ